MALGKPAREKDFFIRPVEIQKIYRQIKKGANVFISGPRRVGKTSIVLHLADHPENGIHFTYSITESARSSSEFFETLVADLVRDKEVQRRMSGLTKAMRGLGAFITKLKGLGIAPKLVETELHIPEEINHAASFESFLEELIDKNTPLVIIIDEFPMTVENILADEGEKSATHFLQLHRRIRHNPRISEYIRFIYTGSVGLPAIVKKMEQTHEINDLSIVEIAAFQESEAKEFVSEQLLKDGLYIGEEERKFLLHKLQWHIPFHLSLFIEEIIIQAKENRNEISKALVDKSFDKLLDQKYTTYFEHYRKRLKKVFDAETHSFVLEILCLMADKNKTSKNELYDLAAKNRQTESLEVILDVLMYDGYLTTKGKDGYCFISPLLKAWWRKHVCK